jgi:uridine kinase|tara:strand:+ start:447 stop:884 length:438 start_codon:yes stop_codon:yes gene_type:complete
MDNFKLVLVRGLPGSGKTTLAEILNFNEDAIMFSTDDLFMVDGEYKFDASKLSEYHKTNIDNVRQEMQKVKDGHLYSIPCFSCNVIIVHNTFTQEWEMEPYYELAKKYGWAVISLIVENRHEGKSIHGVPDNAIEHMRNRFEIKL